MVFPIAAALGAGASILGTMLQNSQAEAAAAKQMAFQKETLQHSYQWGMEDMKKAGLNPILAYKQGGAGSAGGSSYTPGNIGTSAVSGATTSQSSALATTAQKSQLENMAADTALKHSQDKTQGALEIQALATAQQANANSALAAANTQKVGVDTLIAAESLKTAKAGATRAELDERMLDTELGGFARQAGTLLREMGLVSGGRN